MVDVTAEIRAGHPPNESQKRHRLNQPAHFDGLILNKYIWWFAASDGMADIPSFMTIGSGILSTLLSMILLQQFKSLQCWHD
jgi:membrane protein YqaA with SNARE-associated domain